MVFDSKIVCSKSGRILGKSPTNVLPMSMRNGSTELQSNTQIIGQCPAFFRNGVDDIRGCPYFINIIFRARDNPPASIRRKYRPLGSREPSKLIP